MLNVKKKPSIMYYAISKPRYIKTNTEKKKLSGKNIPWLNRDIQKGSCKNSPMYFNYLKHHFLYLFYLKIKEVLIKARNLSAVCTTESG